MKRRKRVHLSRFEYSLMWVAIALAVLNSILWMSTALGKPHSYNSQFSAEHVTCTSYPHGFGKVGNVCCNNNHLEGKTDIGRDNVTDYNFTAYFDCSYERFERS